jgi:predicted aspartyl protease
MRRTAVALLLPLLALLAPAARAETCDLRLAAELPIGQAGPGMPILVQASIRNQPIPMIVDTGSPMTTIDRGTAERFGLALRPDSRIRARGLGGELRVYRVTVPEFALGPQRIDSVTIGAFEGMRSDARQMGGGLLGQDVLGAFDLEFEVQNNRLALYDKSACAHAPPWDLDSMTVPLIGGRTGRIQFDVKLDGQILKAELDSGAARTTLTWKGAMRLGLQESSSGMESGGSVLGVDGKPLVRSFYRFQSFEVGGELIRNPRLGIVDFHRTRFTPDLPLLRSQEQPDLLLGADWLRAHRVYVARGAGEMHFSYLGGVVFEK